MAKEGIRNRPCRYCGLLHPACKCKGYKKRSPGSSGTITIENWVKGVTIGEMLDHFNGVFPRRDLEIAFKLQITSYEEKNASS